MFDIYAFILQLILMANSYAGQGYQYDYTKGLNENSFTAPAATRPETVERQRVQSIRGL